MKTPHIQIPLDIYESPSELVILMPLAGVQRESVKVHLQEYTLLIAGERTAPKLKDDFIPLQQECFWGSFQQKIDLPGNVEFHQIYSKITKDNLLVITIPKTLLPEQIRVEIEE
jgi:HSP20 family molecular chaperone IbpA